MQIELCKHILYESGNIIYVYDKIFSKWKKRMFVAFGEASEKDLETTGFFAYKNFYNYCGEKEVEKMKHIFQPIDLWESCEQMHYANVFFAKEKIYKNIYEFDANSAFTYGTLQLPNGFEKLKEYMLILYENKKNAETKLLRSRFKNLQNYLIGYFARIKDFVRVRSEVIKNSNENITSKMNEITKAKGTVYLSNTDSIVTDEIGAEIMAKYEGGEVGQFKLSTKTDRLYYNSSNSYQLGNKIVYSGVQYFARKHTDFFNDISAYQRGSLLEEYDIELGNDGVSKRICRIRFSEVQVDVFNAIGEKIDEIIYTLKEY